MNEAFIGLGSNLNTPMEQLQQAITQLKQHAEITNVELSKFYSSKPVGPQDQPDYVNAVAIITTSLAPIPLLDALQAIENSQHRVRERHWGPRTLDLDLLKYNNDKIDMDRLTVPHPFMLERGFVIKPMADLAPEMLLDNGCTVTEQLSSLDTSDLIPL
ncbi:MAG: 2-amino-4-hydroxy-6-hydroxymethyldihydropteridine diphosphokinase [Marinomonas sp.]|jgi:2-amino-4-hydroxy-6-hydroxymethyldihydropteridine diphosphokinase|uniref:2-amino-4-hydroxy-6- hydroxymethyldihydropteridine diphosphokinase n=1 Tax=unclassified Marinomonas TaxID=196814 RepID=UPI0005FA1A1F|nr:MULTISPECIES: 2-amino-4-hydroxy-6-hydroxymethyldihydropteridine diphosphokinase [unclassified Marinomonas]KJZ15440.1 2-amino-4-hydroxy-6-hydroxymethyldihydropteridine pyrophosphokinase [Marinomonas sp. S3726]KZM39797.1 2-amino-4-hydroxy-6-hydroxymethyldihydropteridine pyrophosphokinase [Marinomonas sp. SBI22]KZM41173.1 2-amino-4-hydroxy-6-hydroxymethyldihydropteridine pyrophosphokinase [Marinomonas sp. SBI8L]